MAADNSESILIQGDSWLVSTTVNGPYL